MAAPYWADSKISSDGGVYATFITDVNSGSYDSSLYEDILDDAEWAFVVTWEKMTPNTSPVDENQVE